MNAGENRSLERSRNGTPQPFRSVNVVIEAPLLVVEKKTEKRENCAILYIYVYIIIIIMRVYSA